MKGIIDAKALAAYICKKFKVDNKEDISPVRLQKTLYFCFAYWGGFVRKSTLENSGELNFNGLSEKLFDNRIEAWVYGPVIPDVYFESNVERFYNENLFQDKKMVQDIVDNVIEDTYSINDFRLVDISHKDQSWISKFDYDEQYHNNEIIKEDIIDEYARK